MDKTTAFFNSYLAETRVKEEVNDMRSGTVSEAAVAEIMIDLDQIDQAGRHLLALIGDILEVSKSEANVDKLEAGEVQVQMLCREVVDMVQLRVKENGNELLLSLPDQEVVIRSDEQRLRLILTNLLQNAAKFTENGTISLAAELQEEAYPREIRFTIEDTGIGIDQATIDQIFEPFFQIDSSYSRRAEGSGLGLNICKRIVEILGGTIKVESRLGEGTRFIVSVPADLS